jgi:hypothetical protein
MGTAVGNTPRLDFNLDIVHLGCDDADIGSCSFKHDYRGDVIKFMIKYMNDMMECCDE